MTRGDAEDEMLDRLDAGEPASSPEERAARAPYEALLGQIRALPRAESDPAWKARAGERFRQTRAAERRRRRLAIGVPIVALAALAVILALVVRRDPQPQQNLEITVLQRDGVPRRGTAAVDDTVQVRAQRQAPNTELRLYRDTRLVARCPGDPGCTPAAGTLTLELILTQPGRYQAVLLSSTNAIAPPGTGGLDTDVLAARTAGAVVPDPRLIIVTR